MRRPAAAPRRVRVRVRPAAMDPDDGDWEKASEVNIRELNAWPAIYIQGLYWDSNAEVIGEMKSLAVGEEGIMLTIKAHGTTSEELLKLLSGKASKLLCDDPCSHLTWKEGLLHAQRLKRCQYEDYAWSRNAEVSVREAERERERETRWRSSGEKRPSGAKALVQGRGLLGWPRRRRIGSLQKKRRLQTRRKRRRPKSAWPRSKVSKPCLARQASIPERMCAGRCEGRQNALVARLGPGRARETPTPAFQRDFNSGGRPLRGTIHPGISTSANMAEIPGVLTSTMILEAQKVMMLQLGAGLHEAEGQSLRPMVTQNCHRAWRPR